MNTEVSEELASFLTSLKHFEDQKRLLSTLREVHLDVFSKTDCLTCAKCCKTAPPIITQQDIKRIAKYLNLPPKSFKRKYVIDDLDGTMCFHTVPCVFLQYDNTCSIYEVRPEACRRYPHTDEDEYPKRAALNIKNLKICPAAVEIAQDLQKKLNN